MYNVSMDKIVNRLLMVMVLLLATSTLQAQKNNKLTLKKGDSKTPAGELYGDLACKGHAESQYFLGMCYGKGELGLERDT